MKRCRFTEDPIIMVLKEYQAGMSAADLWQNHGISDATFYNWRSKYICIEEPDGKKLKALEVKNASLNKVLGKSVMDFLTLKVMLGKNF